MKREQRTRRTVVELHPKRKQIEKALAEDVPIRALSEKYKISRQALEAYKRNRLPKQIIKSVERRNITDANELFTIILKAVQRMEKLSDSCDDYLQDPERPDMYYLGPQASEIDVVYIETRTMKNGRQVQSKRKSTLQQLIAKMESGDKQVLDIKYRATDPRALLVQSSDSLTKQMATLVEAYRAIDQGKSSFLGTPAWNAVVKVIQDATKEYPEVRRLISDGLSRLNS